MYHMLYFIVLVLFSFNLCWCYYAETIPEYEVREELVVTKLEVVEDFKFKSKVTRWKSISVGATCYTAGSVNTSLTLLFTTLHTNGSIFNINHTTMDIGRKPTDLQFLHFRKDSASEIILIATFLEAPQVIWYRVEGHLLKQFWNWKLQNPVVHLNHFMIDRRSILILVFNDMDSSLDMFEFDIKSKKPTFWFLESITLTTPTNTTAINQIHGNHFLSVPQNDLGVVLVYKYADRHFVWHKKINSPGVTSIVTFDIMFKTFLAIDGYNAGIFEFCDDGEIRKRHIINSNLDGFHYWLPVPVNTLRDDVILLAQRYLDHGSHKAYVVEIITYNGVEFEEHEDIPCEHFGENVEWLTCLGVDNGIMGSTFVAVGEEVGLIVPRSKNGSSLLYNIHLSIRQIENPRKRYLENLEDLKIRLQKHIQTIENNLHLKSLRTSDSVPSGSERILGIENSDNVTEYEETVRRIGESIDDLEEYVKNITQFESGTDFQTIIINGLVTMEGEVTFEEMKIDSINDSPATALLEDIVRKNNISDTLSNKTFSDLHVDNISFETVNGVHKDEILFKGNGSIYINASLIFENNVTVDSINVLTNKLNDIDLENDLVYVDKQYEGTIKFENVNVTDKLIAQNINNLDLSGKTNGEGIQALDNLHIAENVTVNYINHVNFTEFIQNLCFVNVNCYIPGAVRINVNISAQKSDVESINNLQFPEDFVSTNDDVSHVNITGHKKFENLIAKDIRMTEAINGLDTSQIVTLSTDQMAIPGKVTFKNLELTEELNVTGNIIGEHVDKFLPNPTLNTTKLIKANVDFTILEVEGRVIVEKTYNGRSFDAYISDIVYDDVEGDTVTAKKNFPKGVDVLGDLEVQSNEINGVNLDSVVTKDTSQSLDMNLIKGNVKIGNLILKGQYDGVDVTELDENLVKLTGEQFISSTLIFNNDIKVESLEVARINDLLPEEYIYASEGGIIKEAITFENITVERLVLDGNLTGNISNLDLKSIQGRYLSLTKNQTVTLPWHIKFAEVDRINITNVDDHEYGDIFDDQAYSRDIRKRLEEGTLQVENLRIRGSIKVDQINKESIDHFLPTDPIVGVSKSRKMNVTVMGDIYFDDIEIKSLSNVSWKQLLSTLVFKNETDVKLCCARTFNGGFIVEKLIETKKINNVSLENIFRIEGTQNLIGPITFHGDVIVEDLRIADNLNEVDISEILNHLNVVNGTYILKGDKLFERLVHIYDFKVEGTINGHTFTDVVAGAVFLKKDNDINGNITFKDKVTISGNLAVDGLFNDLSFKQILPNIAIKTKDTEIEGSVSFAETVIVKEHLKIDETLDTGSLFGINTSDWLANAVYTDKGLIEGSYKFEEIEISGELITKFINDTSFERMIPLNTNQSIDYLKFKKVISVKNIKVGNKVNGHKLLDELHNTVMSNLDQEIASDIVFQNHVLVRGNLTTQLINNKPASKIVTTYTDQNLTGKYNFITKVIVDREIEVLGLISGININKWESDTLAVSAPKAQRITNRWDVSDHINFEGDVFGGGFIESINLTSKANEVRDKLREKLALEENVVKDCKGMCADLKYMYDKARKQIFKFKYFEEFQRIYYPHNIQNTFFFEHGDGHFLLVNDENCLSHLLRFKLDSFYPLVERIETGSIGQIVPVHDEGRLYLVTRHTAEYGCKVQGTQIWEFVDDEIKLRYVMENLDLIQESQVPSTFYGLNDEGVIEYRLNSLQGYHKYRRWNFTDDDAHFVPRGFNTGLALRTGNKLVMLERLRSIEDNEDIELDSETTLRGKIRIFPNHVMPGRYGGDVEKITVGITGHKRNLLGVIENSGPGNDGKIKIYSNPLTGELMQEIPASKPSSLISVEFEQAETLIAFIENNQYLQVYEYKGILGFKHRSTIRTPGSKLFVMTLPIESHLNPRKCIGIIYEDTIRLIESIMEGNQLMEELTCDL